MIANVDAGMMCQNKQIFGPVVGIQSVKNSVEAQKIINSSKYCLESYVFTREEKSISYFS